MYPTVSRYIEALSEPAGFFRTITPECERDVYGVPKMVAGGNAAVFKVRVGGKLCALKCYTKSHASIRTVYESLPQQHSNLLYESRLLAQEIYISDARNGKWYDATLTEWAEGHTLEFAIRKALRGGDGTGSNGGRSSCNNGNDLCDGSNAAIAKLAENFDLLAGELLASPWAHGDLKPENIIVTPSGRMRLIDYDAMFVPQLAGRAAEECGTPLYQHPRRGIHHFDRHIDDYPIALISATLHTLSLDANLHTAFGSSDSLLFTPADILDGQSAGHRAALDMAARRGEYLLYGLLRLLASPIPEVDGLKDIIAALNDSGSRTAHTSTLFVERGRWGWLADDGSIAIPPVFDTALEFKDGTATVRIGGYEHSLDRKGRLKFGNMKM